MVIIQRNTFMPKKASLPSEVLKRRDEGINQVLRQHGPHDVQWMTQADLMAAQTLLEQRAEADPWGAWSTPQAFIPGLSGSLSFVNLGNRIKSYVDADLRQLIDQGPSEQPFIHRLFDDAIVSSVRYLVLCCCGPVSLQNQRDCLDRSFVAWMAYNDLPRLASISITKAMRGRANAWLMTEDVACFSRLAFADIQHLKAPQHEQTFRRMQMLGERKLWNDCPSARSSQLPPVLSGPAIDPAPSPATQPHKPLPDDYVAEIGWRSQWLMRELYPNVERVLKGFEQIWEKCATDELSMSTLGTRCAEYLACVRWVQSDGTAIEAVPFELRLSTHGRKKKSATDNPPEEELDADDAGGADEDETVDEKFVWPPKRTSQIFGLARVIQGAHFFISGLSMAARTGEFSTLTRNCLVEAEDGSWTANGKTYKLVLRHEGEARSWNLPAAAVQALQQQCSLVGLLERLSPISDLKKPSLMQVGTHLWGRSGGTADRSLPLDNQGLLHLLKSYAKAIGMEPHPGGQPIRIHRLRKTLARLAALALFDAPKILQQCFGHLDIAMTMYYIMTDKDLAAEIETILDELRVMRATETVQEIFDSRERARASSSEATDDFTGKGSEKVRRAIDRREKIVESESRAWQLEDTRAVAEDLTYGGKSWMLVRPGVICTRSIGDKAPCTTHRGQPNPNNCQSHCDNLLQHPSMRTQVDRNIEYALKQYLLDIADGKFFAAQPWARQIRLNIDRFADLKAKWMADATVSSIVLGEDVDER